MTADAAQKADQTPAFDELYSHPEHALAERHGKARAISNAASITTTEVSRVKLVKISELLADIPTPDKVRFLDDLRFFDGEIVSANTEPLKKTLSREQIKGILAALSSPAGTPEKARKGRPRLTVFSDALKGVPDNVRAEFYESLVFRGDEIVSFYASGLRGALGEAGFKSLLGSLNPAPSADEKSLCGDGWCDDSYCDLPPDPADDPSCQTKKDHVCKSNCK
ncbi:MAG: hypothetical protein HY928_15520 [Elusimicrobia bacterium]|nr:hypothetical protein [Elusimicrobiota bacterium]